MRVTHFEECCDLFDLTLEKCMFAINEGRSNIFWGNLGFFYLALKKGVFPINDRRSDTFWEILEFV